MRNDVIFGPVPSRRLGRSLGINLVPHKICTLDCLYCEVGRSAAHTTRIAPYTPAKLILQEFNKVYSSLKDKIDVVTLTGAGEPTLNSELSDIIYGIKETTILPIAILTNSTTLSEPAVAEALLLCDIVVPSLDAVTQSVFEAVDKPAKGIMVDTIINAIADFSHKFTGKLFLELLLVKGVNDSEGDLKAFAQAAKRIKYTTVQLGTVFRPPAWEGTARLTDEELHHAYELLVAEGLTVEPVGVFAKKNDKTDSLNELKAMLKLRPVTINDIIATTGMSRDEVESFLQEINAQKQLYDGEIYYK
ncbi:MAG: radical SAM protein [Deferribacteraceae bacterium]|jgi:wyosine [tRNA(Phe)-imidazoG37] synthetase (radical SAM superfamily)|nr:radical SAM protein [Deferribacteraceae bacterium]